MKQVMSNGLHPLTSVIHRGRCYWVHTMNDDGNRAQLPEATNVVFSGLGAGLEYKLFEHVLVRAEYLHYDFDKTAFSFPGGILVNGVAVPFNPNASERVDAVRGGLSYKF